MEHGSIVPKSVPLCHVPAQLQETASKKTVSTCFLPYTAFSLREAKKRLIS